MNIAYHIATAEYIEDLVESRLLFAFELGGQQPIEMVSNLRNQMRNYFKKAMAEKSCISIVAKCGGKLSGIGSLNIREMPGNFKNPSGKWAYIMNMYTYPEFRRRGICTGILNALVKEGQNLGIQAFELHATKEGEFVYQKCGFELYSEPTYRRIISE